MGILCFCTVIPPAALLKPSPPLRAHRFSSAMSAYSILRGVSHDDIAHCLLRALSIGLM